MKNLADLKEFDYWLAVAKNNNISYNIFYGRVRRLGWEYKSAATTPPTLPARLKYKGLEYALYKGEDLLSVGTLEEIVEETGRTIESLKFMRTPTYKKRFQNSKKALQLVILDDEEDEGW